MAEFNAIDVEADEDLVLRTPHQRRAQRGVEPVTDLLLFMEDLEVSRALDETRIRSEFLVDERLGVAPVALAGKAVGDVAHTRTIRSARHSVLNWDQLSRKWTSLSATLKFVKRIASGMTPLISGVPLYRIGD